jgi:3-methyladenine DNA glycosylase AlkD
VALNPTRVAGELEARLRALGTTERAEHERRYLKSELQHLGATVWQIRREVKGLTSAHPDLSHDELVMLVETLWAKPVHERRMAAVFLLEAYPDLVGAADLPLLERLVREAKSWAYVDGIAGDVVGELILRDPRVGPRLDRWAKDNDFWVRRSALLAQIKPLRHGAPFDRFGRYADAMLDEHEFFIRKAIGWVLRETAKTRPDEVYEWLAPRVDRASGVTKREAIKYLKPQQRQRLAS